MSSNPLRVERVSSGHVAILPSNAPCQQPYHPVHRIPTNDGGRDVVNWLEHPPRVLSAYLLRGEAGLTDLEEQLHEQAHRQPGHKFSKRETAYLPQSPFPPLLWRNQCERCRFYHDGGPGEPATCHIVGREGDSYGGEAIHPRGWCGLYLPPEGEPAFTWLHERLDPDGASSVRGLYKPWLATGQWGHRKGVEHAPTTEPGRPDQDQAQGEGADDDD